MFNSQVHRSLWLALAAVLTVGGCSNTATNGAASTPRRADPARTAAAIKAPPAAAMVTVPKGTAINAMVGQTLASNKNKVGDTFAGSLTSTIKVGGKTVIPKGAPVTGRIVAVKKHELKVTLASVVIRGKSYPGNQFDHWTEKPAQKQRQSHQEGQGGQGRNPPKRPEQAHVQARQASRHSGERLTR